MKIQSVTFLGVRGLRDATYDFTNRETGTPHGVVVLAGTAAAGKTRALEAIIAAKEAIAPYGPMVPGAPWIAEGAAATKVKIAFWLDEEERAFVEAPAAVLEAEVTFLPKRAHGQADPALVKLLKRYSHEPAHGKLEYFPAARSIPMIPPFSGLGLTEQRILRATKDARKYAFVTRFLRDLASEPARAQAFAERLEALSATVRYVPSAGEGLPHCLSSRGGPGATPAEISDSEVDAVLFAATAVGIGLGRSLVLVDRPELHTDAAHLKRFISGLRTLGEGNQLLLASAWPDVAAFAAPAAVVTLEGG